MRLRKIEFDARLLGAIGLVLVILKVVGVEPIASWSWWWITAPFMAIVVISLALLWWVYR